MGEAKRRKQFEHSDVQKAQLERVLEVAYRTTRAGMSAARAATAPAERRRELAEVHRQTGGLVDELTQQYFATDPKGQQTNESLACRRGCSFCCHVNVQVTVLEAVAIAEHLQDAADLKRSLLTAAPVTAGLRPAQRLDRRIPCPLLRDGACSIYAQRPRACRAHTSFNASWCEEALMCGDSAALPPVTSFAWPRTVSKAITHATAMALEHEQAQAIPVEMTQAVALILQDATAIERWLGGEAVFAPYRT